MDTCGLVAEYNPLHRGHLRQLEALRQKLGKSAGIVVCMSGPFCQQGVPALLDKGVRAELALRAGADLILELPQAFATDSAERFAEGAVATLLATGVVRSLAFGTEHDDKADTLRALGAFFAEETPAFRAELEAELRNGEGYAAARAAVAARHIKGADALLRSPNTILAVEYEKALRRLRNGTSGSSVSGSPESEHRRMSDRLPDEDPFPTTALPLFEKDTFSSGKVRDTVDLRFDPSRRRIPPNAYWPLFRELLDVLPPASAAAILERVMKGRGLVTPSLLEEYTLRSPLLYDVEQLKAIRGMQGGLAERVVNRLIHASTLDRKVPGDLFDARQQAPGAPGTRLTASQMIATRAFPAARVRRALLAASLNIRSDDAALTQSLPQYIRVLGYSKNGRHVLSLMRRTSTLPVIAIASQFQRLSSAEGRRQAQLDRFAQSLWNRLAGVADSDEVKRVPVTL